MRKVSFVKSQVIFIYFLHIFWKPGSLGGAGVMASPRRRSFVQSDVRLSTFMFPEHISETHMGNLFQIAHKGV